MGYSDFFYDGSGKAVKTAPDQLSQVDPENPFLSDDAAVAASVSQNRDNSPPPLPGMSRSDYLNWLWRHSWLYPVLDSYPRGLAYMLTGLDRFKSDKGRAETTLKRLDKALAARESAANLSNVGIDTRNEARVERFLSDGARITDMQDFLRRVANQSDQLSRNDPAYAAEQARLASPGLAAYNGRASRGGFLDAAGKVDPVADLRYQVAMRLLNDDAAEKFYKDRLAETKASLEASGIKPDAINSHADMLRIGNEQAMSKRVADALRKNIVNAGTGGSTDFKFKDPTFTEVPNEIMDLIEKGDRSYMPSELRLIGGEEPQPVPAEFSVPKSSELALKAINLEINQKRQEREHFRRHKNKTEIRRLDQELSDLYDRRDAVVNRDNAEATRIGNERSRIIPANDAARAAARTSATRINGLHKFLNDINADAADINRDPVWTDAKNAPDALARRILFDRRPGVSPADDFARDVAIATKRQTGSVDAMKAAIDDYIKKNYPNEDQATVEGRPDVKALRERAKLVADIAAEMTKADSGFVQDPSGHYVLKDPTKLPKGVYDVGSRVSADARMTPAELGPFDVPVGERPEARHTPAPESAADLAARAAAERVNGNPAMKNNWLETFGGRLGEKTLAEAHARKERPGESTAGSFAGLPGKLGKIPEYFEKTPLAKWLWRGLTPPIAYAIATNTSEPDSLGDIAEQRVGPFARKEDAENPFLPDEDKPNTAVPGGTPRFIGR